MIDMPAKEVIDKIIEQANLSPEEAEQRIKEKLKQLSGLISEDGAAHIVANELNVQLYKTEGTMKISELNTAAKSAIVAGKVLQKYEVRTFERNGNEGKVANMLIGDSSGKIRVVFWNDQVNIFENLKENDVLRMKNPYVKENNGRFEIHLNDRSDVDINPAGVTVDVPNAPQREQRDMKYLKDLEGNEENVEVLATIVQVYDPRFFDVCPECNKRAIENNCPTHGSITPVLNYVTTAFLDDGTANVRTTFWKQQTQRLFDLDDSEIAKWKDSPELSNDAKHELLGEIVKVVGRAKRNEQFDRIDFTANLIFKDIDPEKELARLKGEDSKEDDKRPINKTNAAAQETKEAKTTESETQNAEKTQTNTDEQTSSTQETSTTTETPSETKPIAPDTTVSVQEPTSKAKTEPEPSSTTASSTATTETPEEKKKPTGNSTPAFEEEVISIDDLEDL